MSSASPEAVLELRGVTAGYGGPPVLRDVGLSVAAGEFCGVLGPNGGGKSTLLKVVLGLLAPSHGSVRVLGKPPGRARGDVGYLPQDAGHDPAFPVTVRDVVGMGLLTPHPRDWLPGRRRERRDRVDDALQEAGLADLAGHHLGQLSGGQRGRVLLVRALICEPRLLVLDEPTTGLDPGAAAALHEQLAALRDRGQVSALVVSHDLAEVEDLATRTVEVDGTLHQGLGAGPPSVATVTSDQCPVRRGPAAPRERARPRASVRVAGGAPRA